MSDKSELIGAVLGLGLALLSASPQTGYNKPENKVPTGYTQLRNGTQVKTLNRAGNNVEYLMRSKDGAQLIEFKELMNCKEQRNQIIYATIYENNVYQSTIFEDFPIWVDNQPEDDELFKTVCKGY